MRSEGSDGVDYVNIWRKVFQAGDKTNAKTLRQENAWCIWVNAKRLA